MRIPLFLATIPLLALATSAQIAPNTPAARQPTTRPATRPVVPATRPASLKEARRIVFLVDTRIHYLRIPQLREELRLAVDHLRDDQRFTIIILRPQGQVPKIFNQNPIRADDTAKRAAADFLRTIEDERATNPLPAIRKAVELEPDFLCFIPDDDTPQSEAVHQAFAPLHGRLNIVLFTGVMPHPVEFLRILALEHGGTAMDQKGNVLEPPKPKVLDMQKPESRPSIFER